ncbi:hypothetical protein BN1723_013725 [Verticillium longisporum]|uniref:alpha-1,2-Mannosidase n=1 Tax=Verticillium longisporum TaxID=100787 RepID=A0A0G4LED9_VERLO|nr:Mannosyl-oligosaccharide 1 like protein [Verticillium longisporum]CRK20376.1 hypothetical protein BN1708_012841 [Verticillium longisporum]CRK25870.1 hypothetical protein BN1723_013725 [Verticillium longisporum]
MLAPSRSTRQARQVVLTVTVLVLISLFLLRSPSVENEAAFLRHHMNADPPEHTLVKSSFDWSSVKFAHVPPPLDPPAPPLQTRRSANMPRIQHVFTDDDEETHAAAILRETRRRKVRDVFARDWQSYRAHAWLQDDLNPVSGTGKDQFSGWAATLVDALDTLWIMGLRAEFDEAVDAVGRIDFGASTHGRVNMFETTIRYLGGLLAAHDLSGRPVLLAKAVELGDLLLAGFNTPDGLPVDFIAFERAKTGEGLAIEQWVVAASPGTLSLEMTRLSQVTGDRRYHEAVTRVMRLFDAQQMKTRLPGLWPMWVSMAQKDVSARDEFTLGGNGDSLFEYLPKMHALLGADEDMYAGMTRRFMKTAEDALFFRPMVPDQADILVSAAARVSPEGAVTRGTESEHLACFIGGTFALAGRLLQMPAAVETGGRLARGCAYAYGAFASGMMPERFDMVPCPTKAACAWDEALWADKARRGAGPTAWKGELPRGFTTAKDPRYRITGDAALQDTAWAMFEAVANGTAAAFGHGSVKDVTVPQGELVREDYMESFWLAETLKYFYLVFSPPNVISLDEFVLNTEAHPLRMPS